MGMDCGVLLSSSLKHESTAELKKQIVEFPRDKYPIIIAGGSFNNDSRSTKVRVSSLELIDRLCEEMDPSEVYFVIGDKLNGYEKYLADKCKDRFTVIAIVPTVISAYERNKLIESQVGVVVSIDPTGKGLYKSFAYEIFKRRESTLIALDGNSAGVNLIQEAKNAKYRCDIFVSRRARVLRSKAKSLEGYVTLLSEDEPFPVPVPNTSISQPVV